MPSWFSRFISPLVSFSGRCVVCRKPLRPQERDICTCCLSQLPLTHLSDHEENILEKYFWGKIPVVHASALFIYYQGADSHMILRNLKYGHQPSVGITLGRVMATYLADTSFFDSVDAIVAVPLAGDRQRHRGYNQAECLAKGIQEITRLPIVSEGIVRHISNKSQTRLSHAERYQNVDGIFKVELPERFYGKHILLVDDVVTSTATLTSLARAFGEGHHTRFSILTLAMASSITETPYYRVDNREDMENREGEVYMPDDRYDDF